jgi:hypothetical protein
MTAFDTSSGSMTVVNADSTGDKGVSLNYKGKLSAWITGSLVQDINETLGGTYTGGSAISSINISLNSGTFSAGTWKLWGA